MKVNDINVERGQVTVFGTDRYGRNVISTLRGSAASLGQQLAMCYDLNGATFTVNLNGAPDADRALKAATKRTNQIATAAGVQVSHSQPKMVSGIIFEDQYRFYILS